MDVGPFFSSGLEIPLKGNKTERPSLKTVSIKLGPDAAVAFDTERLRMAVGWTGGFLKLPSGREGLEGVPQPVGETVFKTALLPGWANKKGGFEEPHPPVHDGNELISFGPLPGEWAKWRGLYRHGDEIVLSYTVGTASVLELPQYLSDFGAFVRNIEMTDLNQSETLLVASFPGEELNTEDGVVWIETEDRVVAIGSRGTTPAKITTDTAGNVFVTVTPKKNRAAIQIGIWSGDRLDLESFIAATKEDSNLPNLEMMTRGGPAQFGDPLTVPGRLGSGDGAYVVDTITVPEENPWNSWIRCSGFDFFKTGTRAAICSVSGDVWLVDNIDEKLDRVTWKRFATGLFQPLGLKIVDDKIYVTGRDQITRLHDLNGDDEADFYENFNNDIAISSHYHEFALNLDTDSAGNFYFTKGGNLGPAKHQHHGTHVRVSQDGGRLEVMANGLRAPNGASVGPGDVITSADNEGNWVPASRVNLVKPGGFYGHVFTSHTDVPPTSYDRPLIWLPHTYELDNSSGGQVWVTSDRWGPFQGDLLHLSYGACTLWKVMTEEVNGVMQAGAVRFPLKFDSGMMRGRFNAQDGQLYLCGLVVWQSKGPRKGAFQRVRYTGRTVNMPSGMSVKKDSIDITFTDPLNRRLAEDPGSFAVRQWNYRWTKAYGSKHYKATRPDEEGEDVFEVKSTKLSDDGRTVTLKLDQLTPVMQMSIQYSLDAADGALLEDTIYNTINEVP